jgi:uncharacterized membrane protein
MWKRLRAIFFSGLIALLPITLTVFILQLLYQLIESSFGSGGLLGDLVRFVFGTVYLPESVINLIAIFATILIILLMGAITHFYIGRRIYASLEHVVLSIPFLRKVYSTFKQLTDSFFNRDISAFKRVVVIEYPRPGLYMIGFETNRSVPGVEEVVDKRLVSIFVMSPPNPIAGIWIIAPEKDVIYLDHITVEEGFRMVMSLGISIAPEIRERWIQQQSAYISPQAAK